MKRYSVPLIAGGALCAVLCAVLAWLLLSALSASSEKAEECEAAWDDLNRVYRAKIFPTLENIAAVREAEETLGKWYEGATNALGRGAIAQTSQTPSGFKQTLQDTVRDLASAKGRVSGRICPPNFYFGFDRYLGDSAVLPANGEIASKLAWQLEVISRVSRLLCEAGAVEISQVVREPVDEMKVEEEPQMETRRPSRRGSRRRGAAAEAAAQQENAASTDQLAKKHRFAFSFRARPDALVEAVNRLSSMEPFAVVASVAFTRPADPVAAYAQSRRGGDETRSDLRRAENQPAEKKIFVTAPELDEPLAVEVKLDVCVFEGV